MSTFVVYFEGKLRLDKFTREPKHHQTLGKWWKEGKKMGKRKGLEGNLGSHWSHRHQLVHGGDQHLGWWHIRGPTTQYCHRLNIAIVALMCNGILIGKTTHQQLPVPFFKVGLTWAEEEGWDQLRMIQRILKLMLWSWCCDFEGFFFNEKLKDIISASF